MPVRLNSRAFHRSFPGLAAAFALAAAGAGVAGDPDGLQDVPIAVTAVTAEDIRTANANERSILDALNAARADPAEYARSLRGPGAAEAQANLRGLAPAPPLTFSDPLSAAALSHAEVIGPRGLTTHAGTDGSTPGVRVRQRGFNSTMVAEELAFGSDRANDVIRNLVIDRGVPGAPHRRDLFNPVFTHAGVGCGPHRRHGRVCVIVLSNAPLPPPATPQAPVAPPPSPVVKLCWVDSKTGKVVPDAPPGGAEADLTDPRRAHNSRTGENFHRGPDGSWVNSKTGAKVRTYPRGAKPDLTDPRRAYNPETGQNFHRAPCPPPTPAAPMPPPPPSPMLCWFSSRTGERVRDYPYMSGESGDANHAYRASTGDNFHRTPDGGWMNSRTGAPVKSYPYRAEPGVDERHAHRSTTGDNFHRAPCPPKS